MASENARFSRIVVVGASGQLGTDLMDALAPWNPVGLTHADISIEDDASVTAALERYNPDLLINTAAFHNVQVCEYEPLRALEVNGVAVGALARACEERQCAVATFSTDYVFDGTKDQPYGENDKPRPIQAYGLSKLAASCLSKQRARVTFLSHERSFRPVRQQIEGLDLHRPHSAGGRRGKNLERRQRHDVLAVVHPRCRGNRSRSRRARRLWFVPRR